MSMHDPNAPMASISATVLDQVDRGAASIEQAFLAAGQGLGRGLDTFNGISGSLAEFLGTLQGGRMAAASSSIGVLAQRLVAISEALPRDAALLHEIAAGNDGIGKHFEALLEHIRMMTIIASSARIEAAVFGEAAGLDSFTVEISTLTASVRTALSRCGSEHAAMTERISRLHKAQAALDRDFRERLLVLARELSETFALITERQAKSHTMAEGLRGLSATISQNTGAALMALQSGDAARQRLEHIATALRLGQDIADGRPALELGDAIETSDVLNALHSLQAEQLADVADHFGSDAADIDVLLRRLSDDTALLVSESRTVIGSKGRDDGSFLTVFRGRLADAAELVGTCDRARRGVASAMVVLRTDVTELSRTVAELGVITRDLIVVGINAGLKATRLGAEGRSLMVIADELKRLAGLITDAAAQLVGAYEALVLGSRSLDRDDEPTPGEMDADILSIAAELEHSDTHMSGFLGTLQGHVQQFDAELNKVQARFDATVAAITALGDGADAMASAVTAMPEKGCPAAAHLTRLLWPHYTMVREREVHSALLGDGAEAPDALSAAGGGESLDDLLFGQAA